mmetsp:Transcript_59609/g.153527  ORF Transcript_59609/g.153527 Transcript_59609/m.153527 type:complete len:348 (+) Transcript_59609:132-1175(+)
MGFRAWLKTLRSPGAKEAREIGRIRCVVSGRLSPPCARPCPTSCTAAGSALRGVPAGVPAVERLLDPAHLPHEDRHVQASRGALEAVHALHELLQGYLVASVVLDEVVEGVGVPNLELHGGEPHLHAGLLQDVLELLPRDETVAAGVRFLEKTQHPLEVALHRSVLLDHHHLLVGRRHVHRLVHEHPGDHLYDGEAHDHLVDDHGHAPPLAHVLDEHARGWYPVSQRQLEHRQQGPAEGAVVLVDILALGEILAAVQDVRLEHAREEQRHRHLTRQDEDDGPEEDREAGADGADQKMESLEDLEILGLLDQAQDAEHARDPQGHGVQDEGQTSALVEHPECDDEGIE